MQAFGFSYFCTFNLRGEASVSFALSSSRTKFSIFAENLLDEISWMASVLVIVDRVVSKRLLQTVLPMLLFATGSFTHM